MQAALRTVLQANQEEEERRRRRRSEAHDAGPNGNGGGGNQSDVQRKKKCGKNALLVTVESERCAPSAVWMAKRAASAVLAGRTAVKTGGEYEDDAEKWCERIGSNGVIVPHLYRLVAKRGATGAWQAIAGLLGRGSSKRSDETCDLVVVCGVTRPGASARGPAHDENSLVARLSSWLIEESAIVMRVHAPRMDHSQGTEVLVTITTAPSRASVGKTILYTGRIARYGLCALEEYKALSLDAEIRHRLGIDDEGSNDANGDGESDAGDDHDATAASVVVLPYVHEGNAMTASGRAEDFLPISAGGKLKDKNDKPGVIFYARDSDDEVYDSDEDPDDDLDI